MGHRTRYRVLAKSKTGELYTRDHGMMQEAMREAHSLFAGGWSDIAIHDSRLGVLWTLRRWEEPRP